MFPDVHVGTSIVTGLIAAHVSQKGLEALEGPSAVPAGPQLSTHVIEGDGGHRLTGRGVVDGSSRHRSQRNDDDNEDIPPWRRLGDGGWQHPSNRSFCNNNI